MNALRQFIQQFELRKAQDDIAAAVKKQHDDCPHMQGCLGPWHGSLTSIIWHTFEDDAVHPKGICSVCQRVFVYTDPDYKVWVEKKSAHRPSTGGFPRPVSPHPYSPGTLAPTRELAVEEREDQRPLVEEGPINMTLKEFIRLELKNRRVRYEDNCGDAVRIDL